MKMLSVKYDHTKNNGNSMTSHLMFVIPSEISEGFPSDLDSARSGYEELFQITKPSKLTLLQVSSSSPSEAIPKGIEELLIELQMDNLLGKTEVKKIPELNIWTNKWEPSNFLRNYFQPLSHIFHPSDKILFFVGTGSGWIQAFMIQLAISVGGEIYCNTPKDEDGSRSLRNLNSVTRGISGYRRLFGNKSFNQKPARTHRLARNLLVKLLEGGKYNDKWIHARMISGSDYLPESQGISATVSSITDLIISIDTEDGKAYSLTPEGLIAAIATRNHHRNVFGTSYQDSPKTYIKSDSKFARGVITCANFYKKLNTLEDDDYNAMMNNLASPDAISVLFSKIQNSGASQFEISQHPPSVTDVFSNREITFVSSGKSLITPEWNPNSHLMDLHEWLSSLSENNISWSSDISAASAFDRILMTILCHLLDIQITYRLKKEISVPEGIIPRLEKFIFPSYTEWRAIQDFVNGTLLDNEIETLIKSISNPLQLVTKEDYETITETLQKNKSRLDKKLIDTGLFEEASIAGKTSTSARISGWKLNDKGKFFHEFLTNR